jgi:hypothetical protein
MLTGPIEDSQPEKIGLSGQPAPDWLLSGVTVMGVH